MARLAWIVALAAVVVAGLFGFAYSSARAAAAEAQRVAEAEKLRAQGLLVAAQESQRKADAFANQLQADNAKLKAEIMRVKELVPDAEIDSAFHIVTIPTTIKGVKPVAAKPLSCPPCPPARAPRFVPRHLRAPLSGLEPEGGEAWVRYAAVEASDAAAAPRPAAPPSGTGPITLRGVAPLAPSDRGASRGGAPGAEPELGECILANGNVASVEIVGARLRTDKNNKILVGTATVHRLSPDATPLFTSEFQADGSQLVEVSTTSKEARGRGWGLGVFASAWDGSQTVGPVLALPTARAWGHSLEAAVTVGVGPTFSVGAMALARY